MSSKAPIKFSAKGTNPCDLFRPENMAIAMSYFTVGCVNSMQLTPTNLYMVRLLDASPQQQTTVIVLLQVPWALKLLFGFMSDAVPIGGLHRKPYLLIGVLIYSFFIMSYGIARENSFEGLCGCVFISTLGLIMMDVMSDTMVVERSKFEPERDHGQMQASCYSMRFAGAVVGAFLAIFLTNHHYVKRLGLVQVLDDDYGLGADFHTICVLMGLVPMILVFPLLYPLVERYRDVRPVIAKTGIREGLYGCMGLAMGSGSANRGSHVHEESALLETAGHEDGGDDNDDHVSFGGVYKPPSVPKQMQQIWETVQRTVVFGPLSFVYLYNILQVPNVAWQSYLQLALDFPPSILGITVTIGSFMTFLGIIAYKKYFFHASWRNIYIWSTVLTSFFSITQIMLIFQINQRLHMSNYLFSVGDDVIQQFIGGVQFLPVCILYMRLCPEGSEGASYSMLTTFGNIALVCANNVGNLLASIWDVSNHAMRTHQFGGLWRLTLLTSAVSVLPLGALALLPKNQQEQDALGQCTATSRLGGTLFLVVLFASIAFSLTAAWRTVMEASAGGSGSDL